MQTIISPEKSFALLKRYSVPYADWKIAKNLAGALKAAKGIGFPVVLKLVSKKIVHKSDVGAVKTKISNDSELAKAFEELAGSAKRLKVKPEGFLVQKMESGTEVIIGMKKDPQFGAVIVFGLGGIFVEVLKDVSMRIAPLAKEDCIEMIEEIKGSRILKGERGQKPVSIDSIAKILMSVSKISEKNRNISEMDLNPIMVNEKSASVVDARIIIEK